MAVTAPSVTGTPRAFNFTTSGTVVTYSGGGTANATTYDVLCVNSDNIVTTPAGWTAAVSAVTNQGAYIFYKSGGTTSATLALGGGVASNTSALWLRITNATAADAGGITSAQINSVGGSTTPTATTSTLSETTELVIAFSASHNFGTIPATGAWSSGYTEQIKGSSVTGGTATWAFGSLGTKVPAGTAAESPSYTWSGGTQAQNRYLLITSFTGFDAGSGGTAPTGIAATVALGNPTVSLNLTTAPSGIAVTTALGSHTVALNRTAAPNGIAATVALGVPSVSSTPGPSGIGITAALGNPTVALTLAATPNGIAVTTALGSHTVSLLGSSPTGISATTALGSHTVSLSRSAAPSGISVSVSFGNPTVVSVSAPSGISVSASLGSPSVSATVLTAGAPGSWYGLFATDELNRQYARDQRMPPISCPNDGTVLQRNPRSGALQCSYDGWMYAGW